MKKKMILSFLLLFVISSLAVMGALSNTKVISVSLVNQDPDPAIAGAVIDIRLGVENIGGKSAENLVLEIVPEYPFSFIAGENGSRVVDTIKAYQYSSDMKIVKFKVKIDNAISAGQYELKIKEYELGSSISSIKSVYIDVKNRENAEVIYIDKTTIIPGRQSGLKFTINNVGNAPLNDLKFSWENADSLILPVGGDNTKYIKKLDVGKSAELEYQVIADTNAVPGLYKLDLKLTYADIINGSEKTVDTIAGVYIGGGTDFDVALSESTMGETSFSIANIGSNPASSVSVSVPQQSGWTITGTNSVIIGNLNTGDYTVATFKLKSNSAAVPSTKGTTRDAGRKMAEGFNRSNMQNRTRQDTNNLRLKIAYTDTKGERNIVEKTVMVGSASSFSATSLTRTAGAGRVPQQSALSTYKWHLAIFVLMIVVILLYRKYAAIKIQNSNFKIKDILKKKKK